MPVTTAAKKTVTAAKNANPILVTATMVDKLTKGKALPMIDRLVEESDFNYFQIGGVLAKIQEFDWWNDLGYDTFKDFMENKYGIKYRRGMHWISIYRNLTSNEIPWDAVKGVGWSKLKEFADLLTPENVEEWVERAESMTVIQLQEYIKGMKATKETDGDEDEDGDGEAPAINVEDISTLTFKVHKDQKETINQAVDQAKEDNDTDSPAVALEYIAMQYLEGNLGKGKAVTIDGAISGKSIEEVLEAVEKEFPEASISVEL